MTDMTTAELDQSDHDICGRLWTGRHARELLDSICYEFGPRPSGSTAVRAARERIATLLSGLEAHDIHSEAVDLLCWQDAPSSIQVRNGPSSSRRAIESIQHVHSAAGDAVGRLIDAGDGLPQELDHLGKSIEGAILLVRERDGYRQSYLPLWMRLPDA